MSNDYYSGAEAPNVDVVTEKIVRVTATGVVTADGVEHEVDTIIFGTGFQVGDGHGARRADHRSRRASSSPTSGRDGSQALLGTTVAGFPNLFVMIGPNTGLGHSSMVYMIESQTELHPRRPARSSTSTAALALDTRRDRQDAFNAEVQKRLEGSVWMQGGCGSPGTSTPAATTAPCGRATRSTSAAERRRSTRRTTNW